MEKRSFSRAGLRGYLRKFPLLLAALLFLSAAHPAQLAVIVLDAANLPSGRLPSGWQLKVNRGIPLVSVCSPEEPGCLRLKSVKASFALERGLDIDPAETPFLSWRWKVTQLPEGGDFRRAATDDQAAQVLVAFSDRRVLTYIWDSTAPKGVFQNASSIPFLHIFARVCQSGAADLNRWMPESHNVAEDYQKAYGKPAPRVKGLRLQVNSQHTGTVAESYFGEVAFRNAPL